MDNENTIRKDGTLVKNKMTNMLLKYKSSCFI